MGGKNGLHISFHVHNNSYLRTSSFNKDMTVKSPTLEDEGISYIDFDKLSNLILLESSDEDDLGSFLSDSSIDSAQ